MRFILFTLEYPPFKGGVANYYGNMVDNWPKNSGIFVLDNDNDRLIRSTGILKWSKSIWVLKKTIKREGIKHVLVGNILPLGISTFILSKFLKIDYSIFLHGLDLSLATKNKWKIFITGFIIRRASRIICANSKVLENLKEIYGDSTKYKVVNPGVSYPTANFNIEENKKRLIDKYELADKHILFSLGRLVTRKGFDNTIKAFKLLNDPKMVYVISGAGPDEGYLKTMAIDFSDRIIFTGKISEEDKWTFFDLSDIFIMPSRDISGDFEGFGIVYLEANLAKRAVIAGNSGGVSDAVIDGFNGVLVDPENINGIANSIKDLIYNENLRLELASNGKERALSEFNWINKSKDIYNFLRE